MTRFFPIFEEGSQQSREREQLLEEGQRTHQIFKGVEGGALLRAESRLYPPPPSSSSGKGFPPNFYKH